MIYQLASGKEIIARIDNNFDIDYSDWVTRAPLWISDALDQMQMISAFVDKKAYVGRRFHLQGDRLVERKTVLGNRKVWNTFCEIKRSKST